MQIYKSDNWEVIFTKWSQAFPGDCIISSNKESLSELTDNEWKELGMLEKELERIIKKLFNATMFNFCCLMNNAYKDKEKTHVHFHFVPRYDGKRVILGKRYKDRHFGYNFWKWELSRLKRQKDIFTKVEKQQIFEMIKKEWSYICY